MTLSRLVGAAEGAHGGACALDESRDAVDLVGVRAGYR
jgi:hypothetical protein